jgi:hypothetical protein
MYHGSAATVDHCKSQIVSRPYRYIWLWFVEIELKPVLGSSARSVADRGLGYNDLSSACSSSASPSL